MASTVLHSITLTLTLIEVLKAVMASTVLHSLDLSHNSIDEMGGIAIANTLKAGSCGLRKLLFSYNNIRAKGGKELGLALEVNDKLTYLDVSQNGLGVLGFQGIARALEVICSGFWVRVRVRRSFK